MVTTLGTYCYTNNETIFARDTEWISKISTRPTIGRREFRYQVDTLTLSGQYVDGRLQVEEMTGFESRQEELEYVIRKTMYNMTHPLETLYNDQGEQIERPKFDANRLNIYFIGEDITESMTNRTFTNRIITIKNITAHDVLSERSVPVDVTFLLESE